YVLRRNVEGGGRQQSFANQTFRAITGVRGAINDGWSYDVSAQFSQGTGTATTLNNFQVDRVIKALDAVVDDEGNIVCQSVVDGSDTGCVPYNPFVPNGVTQDQLDYLQVQGVQIGRISQEIYNGIVTGDLGTYGVKTPWASDGIQVVFGSEWRRDSMIHTVDALQSSDPNQLTGAGGPTIGKSGASKVEELFFEGRVPLAQDMPMMESLSFDTAYRYSDYGDSVQTDTYKFGLEWAPIQDIRLRGSFQHAVRAANIVELFTAEGANLFDAPGDPCGSDARDPIASDAECIASGVPAGLVGSVNLDSPAGQYNFIQGGNPDLIPEESDTQSYGVVFTPRFAPGLSVTIDYFDIEITDTISTFGPLNTWTACYGQNDPAACDRINRNPGTGQLWLGAGNVEDVNINIGSIRTHGYDLNASYTGLEIGRFGSLAFNVTGTYLEDLRTQPAPGIDLFPTVPGVQDTYDCAGYYSVECLVSKPQWRHRMRASWQTPWDMDLSATWRYYGEVTGLVSVHAEMPEDQLDRTLAAQDYFDLAANWAVTEKASLTLGINNVLDDNPPVSGAVGTTGNGNTYPQIYDALGRYVFVRATVDF
ncbi:MAG TPA: TonB-dependent receptor, partial [Steroidobacteraceae bacterium]|nr:TonB-dependent receptor [Steroidobacteraceae bacterium]